MLKTDFPTAWAVMSKTHPEQHHERCSYRTTNGGVLCDCAASQAFIATVRMQEEQKSFSDLIIEGNDAHKRCLTCNQTYVIYKLKFRKNWILCLLAMAAHETPVTYKELADLLDMPYATANSIARTIMRVEHFGLIEATGERRNRCTVYRVTNYGRDFLAGVRAIPEFLWIPKMGLNVPQHELDSLPKPKLIMADDVMPDNPDEINDHGMHIENAVALPHPEHDSYPC